jgi:FdhD protein
MKASNTTREEVTPDAGMELALVIGPRARDRSPLADGPSLSRAGGELLRTIQIVDEYGDHHSVRVPVERPLRITVDDRDVATLWTLGARAEWLVAGYLWSRQLATDVTRLQSITIDWQSGIAVVFTRERQFRAEHPALLHPPAMSAALATDPSGVGMPSDAGARGALSRATLLALLDSLPRGGGIYRAAGSVHGATLFQGADLWINVEDVSRRNAVDTIAGWMLLHGVAGGDKILFTTGRLTAEIVLKAAHLGIPALVSGKGVTAACLDLAARFGMMLFGHASRGRYICFSGIERFDDRIAK